MLNPSFQLPENITIRYHLGVGDIGMLIYLHGVVYAAGEEFDYTYEAQIAHLLGDYIQNMQDRDRIWIVEKDGQVCGSLAIEERSEDEAQLQFFLLHPSLIHQVEVGYHLVQLALKFCRKREFEIVQLWTVTTMVQAIHVFQAAGFQLLEEKTYPLWGKILTEQRYELKL